MRWKGFLEHHRGPLDYGEEFKVAPQSPWEELSQDLTQGTSPEELVRDHWFYSY